MWFFGWKRSPKRTEWPAIIGQLAAELEEQRIDWFLGAVELIRNKGGQVLRASYGGDADLALRAYQLYICSFKIASHQYVQRKDGVDFAEVLYATVSGAQYDEVIAYFLQFQARKDNADRALRFARYLCGYLTGLEDPAEESLWLTVHSGMLIPKTCLAVSRAFGDKREVARISAKM